MMRSFLAVLCAVLMAQCCVLAATPKKVEFAMSMIARPDSSGVNHCVPISTTSVMTAVSGDGLAFSQTTAPTAGSPTLVWTSWTVGQKGNTWNEAGNLTLNNAAGSVMGSVSFASFGYSGHIANPIEGLPGLSYGAITYNITQGTGVWDGAVGVMTDSFVAPANATEFPINAWAVFWVNA